MWDQALQLTKQLLAVQLLPVEGAGPIEQGVVLRVHCLDFIQCGFTTPDPLPEEVKRGQRALTRLSSLDNYSPTLTEQSELPEELKDSEYVLAFESPHSHPRLQDPSPG